MISALSYLSRRERAMVALALLFIVIQVWLDLRLPDYMSAITTLVQTEGSQMSEILRQGGWMLACALGSVAASVIVGYLAAHVAAGLARTLRTAVFEHSLAFSTAEVSRFTAASLINRATNDITQIQNVVAQGLQAIVKAPILATWAVVKVAGKSWQWSAATAVAVLVLCMMLGVIITVAVPRFRRIQGLTDVLNRVTREHLTGIRVVRAYNAEAYQEAAFARANDEITGTNLTAHRVLAVMSPGMSLINAGLALAVYTIGAHLINDAARPARLGLFADMVVFSNYAMQVIMAFMLLTMVFILLPRAQVAATRVRQVIDTVPAVVDAPSTTASAQRGGSIVLEDVSFRYPDAAADCLTGVSLSAAPGETVAIIGATGSGKTSLVDLVPRFHDVTAGRVLVDGVDVRDYPLEELRSRIGYVPQRSYLFSGTIASNIDYPGQGADPEARQRVVRAVATAQSTDFVTAKEGGYDAEVTQGGTNLSGGQRQRLSIARALAAEPEILIFDDSFSALDYATDRALRQALAQRSPRATTLVVAQRIGTIRHADRIVVLEAGRVVGQGTHDELLATCPTYQEIARSQLTEEELRHG
ncbi:MAG: ABC transporter ATP-binding protein [Actinomyces sp.]|uniref:ABC transporter ATP-binding protein n=1 Tax=Actinomyces sp. TaxID=29317 RepID=UPI0026DD579A|nr:ABC transporter ATP-binding protein [Actinomyces sp.]MDO4243024.1 ABC transporter ATP-binding protein [Actinomyces sp.]